jgi:hypothetical protein
MKTTGYTKNTLRPVHKRTLVVGLIERYRVSEIRACKVIRICRTSYRYRSIRDEQVPLRPGINEIARVRARYGYKRIHVLLKQEGCQSQACLPDILRGRVEFTSPETKAAAECRPSGAAAAGDFCE